MVADPQRVPTAFAADPDAVYAFVGRFFAALAAVGVEHVVISPGSRSTPLAIVARRTTGLRSWVELDERAAAFFALGLAKESGRPPLLVCTSGTAAANYLPAVVEAHYARVPMILATADRPPELRDWGAGQTIDQVGLYGRYVRWGVELPVPAPGDEALRLADQLAARAVDTACGTPAGAVHLNWPLREPLPPEGSGLETADRCARRTQGLGHPPQLHARRASVPVEEIEWLVEQARDYERGVICCGPMAASPGLQRAIADFARRAGWPVFADPASNLRTGPDRGDAPILDTGDLLPRSGAFRAAMQPDVVLRIGDAPVSKAQRLWLEACRPAEVVWLDRGGQWGEPSRRATRVLRADAEQLFEAASARLAAENSAAERVDTRWCRTLLEAGRAARSALDRAPAEAVGLSVAGQLARRAPPGARLFASNSMSIRLLDLALARRDWPLQVHASRGASGIDGINSTALGVAAAAAHAARAAAAGRFSRAAETPGPDAAATPATLLLTGDLAFLHDLSGLLIAARERLPLTIVVLDDEGGGIFSLLPIAEQGETVGFEELFQTPHGVDIARIAKALGLSVEQHDLRGAWAATGADAEDDAPRGGSGGSPADEALELVAASITRALERREVALVHVRMDPGRNTAGFRLAVERAVGAVENRFASTQAGD